MPALALSPVPAFEPCFGDINIPGLDLRNVISRIKIDSAYGPDLVIDQPFSPSAPNVLLSRLRPRITIDVKGLATPLVVSPWGDPPATIWPQLKAGGIVVGGILVALAGIGVYHLTRRGA